MREDRYTMPSITISGRVIECLNPTKCSLSVTVIRPQIVRIYSRNRLSLDVNQCLVVSLHGGL